MRTVRLYGHLGARFGREHRLDVRTPAEAVRALCATRAGFRRYLLEHSAPGYRVRVGREPRDLQGLALPADDDIRIVPVTAGAGRGVGSVILGAALVGVGIFTMGGASAFFSATWSSAWAAGGATFVGYLAGNIGMSLIIGGVVQALAPQPKTPGAPERPESKPSYIFDGPVNTAAQGNPVPICYGRLIVGGQVVSAGISAEEYAP